MIRENERSLNILINEAVKYERISEEEQLMYISAYKKYKDKNALRNIVQNNMLYILARARRYISLNIPIGDLVSEGVLGLIQAIDKFNLNKKTNNKFLTFAAWEIRRHMGLFINETALSLHIPHNIIHAHYNVNKALDSLYSKNQFMPSVDQIEDYLIKTMPKPPSRNNIVDALIFIDNIKIAHVNDGTKKNIDDKNKSMQMPDDVDELPDTDSVIDNENITDMLKCLGKLEKQFILDYFQFNGNMDINDIAEKYNTTPDRVAYLHDKVIEKIRKYNK